MNDTELAREIAETAGRLLVDLRNSRLFTGKVLGKAGDQVANAFIMEVAQEVNRPNDAILSEEERDNATRLSAGRVWIVDPLDGTREYGEARADWAVHIALAIDGAAALGAVALPGLRLTLSSDEPLSRPHHTGKLRMVVSRTRPAAEAVAVAEALGAELIPMGSAGAEGRWPWCVAKPISTCILAANTSGTAARRSRWPKRQACIPRGWTAVHCAITSPTHCCLICWCVPRSMLRASLSSPRANIRRVDPRRISEHCLDSTASGSQHPGILVRQASLHARDHDQAHAALVWRPHRARTAPAVRRGAAAAVPARLVARCGAQPVSTSGNPVRAGGSH